MSVIALTKLRCYRMWHRTVWYPNPQTMRTASHPTGHTILAAARPKMWHRKKHAKTLNNVISQNGLTLMLVQVLQVMVMVMWVLLVIKRSCCRRLVMVERILAVYGHWMVQWCWVKARCCGRRGAVVTHREVQLNALTLRVYSSSARCRSAPLAETVT